MIKNHLLKVKPLSMAICVSAATFLGACSIQDKTEMEPTQQAAASQTEQARLLQYFAKMDQQELERSPTMATYRGKKMNYDRWDDISDAHMDESIQMHKDRLAYFRSINAEQLDEATQLSLRLAEFGEERSLREDNFRYQRYVMHQFSGWHTIIPSFLINMHRVKTEQDLKDYLSRLKDVERFLDQVDERLVLHAEKGVYPPRWSFPQMLEASRNVISGIPFSEGKDSTLWADFNKKLTHLNLSEEQKRAYKQQAKDVLIASVKPSYEQLISRLEQQYKEAPEGDGIWRLPNGKAYYDYLLNYYTTTDLTSDQVHQLGLENVKRIHTEMREIMTKVGFKGTLQEFFALMRNDQQFYLPATDEGRAEYLAKATDIIDSVRERLPEYFGILPKAELTVKRVEPFRERSAGKAFYQGPSEDGSRPGIYYANLFNMGDMPLYQMEALAYHEGIPGHHMQSAITSELKGVPEFQKHLHFTAYSEGWGLYSEYLGKEMGFYQDPYSDFGRLAMELWRACRLVVDTGLHAKRWTKEQAIQYLLDNTPNAKNDSIKAIERYIVYPGQATAYLVGKLKILELRDQAEKELGDDFDIRGFHDEILKDGRVPLSILEEKIQKWVKSVQESKV